MLKLYHHHTSVCAAKTRLVLAEKGLEFDGEIIRLRERDQVAAMVIEMRDPDWRRWQPKNAG